jgi:acetolactate synthase-1/2/3 large subunit
MKLTGAQIFWECLVRQGVKHIFGIPGGATLPIYDAMPNYPIHHVLARQEQGAAHMANGYARVNGGVGVAIATSGPGATNLVTGIATAMMDSVPMVCFTGQVSSTLLGTDAFQEVDVTGITLPITKHNYLVTTPEEIAPTIREAFFIASSGRPGPVLVDITKDAQQKTCEFNWDEYEPQMAGYMPNYEPGESVYNEAIKMINEAKRPIILAGQGITLSGASKEVIELAEFAQVPIAMTLLGIGSVPASHPLNLGMMGMHGEAWVNKAIQEADLLLAFGMRFDDRVTGTVSTYAPNAKKIHIDIDPTEINKIVHVDVRIVSDLKMALTKMRPGIQNADHQEWLEYIGSIRSESNLRDIINMPDNDQLFVAHVINDIWKYTNGNAVVVSDVGQHQMWEAQYYKHEHFRSLITSGGLGTMGFSTPTALGAKIAAPEKEVWTIVGDGSFQMSLNELAVFAQENVKVIIAVMNNGYLGMVRQWQEMFYEKRYSGTPLTGPDFVKLAEAYGLEGIHVYKRSEIKQAVEAARKSPRTVVLDFHVLGEDSVYPMVPAGVALDQMIQRPQNGKQGEGK